MKKNYKLDWLFILLIFVLLFIISAYKNNEPIWMYGLMIIESFICLIIIKTMRSK